MKKVGTALRNAKNVLAAALLMSQVLVSQSVIVVRDIHFVGDLGVPETELREYTEFVKGRPLAQSEVLKQSAYAIRSALQHHGFLKAEITPTILDTGVSNVSSKEDRVLKLSIHAGQQYRVNDISFSGLSSEFSSNELRKAIPLQKGDIADANQIQVGIGGLSGLFKRAGKHYFTILQFTFDDTAHSVSFIFNIEK